MSKIIECCHFWKSSLISEKCWIITFLKKSMLLSRLPREDACGVILKIKPSLVWSAGLQLLKLSSRMYLELVWGVGTISKTLSFHISDMIDMSIFAQLLIWLKVAVSAMLQNQVARIFFHFIWKFWEFLSVCDHTFCQLLKTTQATAALAQCSVSADAKHLSQLQKGF